MDTTSKFSSKQAIGFGWGVLKNNFGFLVSLFAGIAVIYLGLAALQDYSEANLPVLFFAVSAADWVLRILISIGLIVIPLMLLDGKKPDYGHLFSGAKFFLPYFIASLLYMLIIVGGLILLVIPGIIWAMRFQFFGYFIVDKNLGPVAALKQSWAATRGEVWRLLGFALLLVVINIAGALAFMVGLLITAPVSLLAMAFVYRKLSSEQAPA